MKSHWFVRFLCIACALKFILNGLLVSCIFAVILGAKQNESLRLKTFLLGVIFGIESAILLVFTGAQPGLSIFLGIFRGLGISLAGDVSYTTVSVISFVYIVLFEIGFIALTTYLAHSISKKLIKQGLHIYW